MTAWGWVAVAGYAERFRQDPAAAFLDIIYHAGAPIRFEQIRDVLVAAGAMANAVQARWRPLVPLLKDHPYVRVVRRLSYQWAAEPIDATEALRRLHQRALTRSPAWLIEALVDVIAPALLEQPGAGQRLRQAQARQWRIDMMRAVAELAIAVEELVHQQADPAGIVAQVRHVASAHQLEPIGTAGAQVSYDPAQHIALIGQPAVGAR
jgi:hypothetical protein